MINYKEIEEKIKSMSAHDIIMAMVEGLRNPKTKIDMSTFGVVKGGICYGCAATNAVLHIIDANEEEVKTHTTSRSPYFAGVTVYAFERAINWLRVGDLTLYNANASGGGFAHIVPMPGLVLPRLTTRYTKKQLQEYVKLAKYQLTQ